MIMRKTTNNTHYQNKQLGFTLIEVMVALVIVAVSLSALSSSLGQFVFQQSSLEERVIATWVADNRLIELQRLAKTGGKQDNPDVEMLGRTWQTELKSEPTLVPGITKASLIVTLKGKANPSATLVSLLAK